MTREGLPAVKLSVVSLPFLAALAAFLTALLSQAPMNDPDTLWHIRVGEWMLSNQRIPRTDPFSHSLPNAPWVAHEWLAEVLMATLYQGGGWALVQVAVAFVYAVTVALLMREMLRFAVPVYAITCVGVAAALMATHLLARPHVFVWPLIALWTMQLSDASRRGVAVSPWLLATAVVWVNLHGSFILAPVLLVVFGFEATLSAHNSQARISLIARWMGYLGVVLFLLMFNPNGWRALHHALTVNHMRVLPQHITEWAPSRLPDDHLLLVWLLLALLLIAGRRIRLPMTRVLMLGGLLLQAFRHGRHQSLLGLMGAIFAAPGFVGAAAAVDTLEPRLWIDRLLSALSRPMRHRGAAVTIAVLALTLAVTAPLWERSPRDIVRLQPAVDAVQRRGLRGPVLNAYGFGGYLVWRRIPVFIDGRIDMYGEPLFTAYDAALFTRTPTALPDLLQQYGIQWTLLPARAPAIAWLDAQRNWRRVYTDSVTIVHERVLEATAE